MNGRDRDDVHVVEHAGVRSQRLLAELQQRALMARPATAVLVEGLSDYYAVDVLASRSGRSLDDEGVAVVPMGGATNLERFVAIFGPAGRAARLAGLCDLGEEALFCRQLTRSGIGAPTDRTGLESLGFFVCERDLEDELIRALGVAGTEAVIAAAGDLASFRRMQQMPFHRGRSSEEQLHRFIGTRSGRKYLYARLMAEALDPGRVPEPLGRLLARI